MRWHIVIVMLATLLLGACTLDQTTQTSPDSEFEYFGQDAPLVVEPNDGSPEYPDLSILPSELQKEIGVEWCPSGTADIGPDGVRRQYSGPLVEIIQGNPESVCKVRADLDGDLLFELFFDETRTIGRTISYLGGEVDSISENWIESGQLCTQFFDESNLPISEPSCV
jgi:hypothetical protein